MTEGVDSDRIILSSSFSSFLPSSTSQKTHPRLLASPLEGPPQLRALARDDEPLLSAAGARRRSRGVNARGVRVPRGVALLAGRAEDEGGVVGGCCC